LARDEKMNALIKEAAIRAIARINRDPEDFLCMAIGRYSTLQKRKLSQECTFILFDD